MKVDLPSEDLSPFFLAAAAAAAARSCASSWAVCSESWGGMWFDLIIYIWLIIAIGRCGASPQLIQIQFNSLIEFNLSNWAVLRWFLLFKNLKWEANLYLAVSHLTRGSLVHLPTYLPTYLVQLLFDLQCLTWLEAAEERGDGVEWLLSSRLVLNRNTFMWINRNILRFLTEIWSGCQWVLKCPKRFGYFKRVKTCRW